MSSNECGQTQIVDDEGTYTFMSVTHVCNGYFYGQDVSGSYVYEFPGMRNVSLSSADAFVIVFALDDYSTWEEASRLRDMVHQGCNSIHLFCLRIWPRT